MNEKGKKKRRKRAGKKGKGLGSLLKRNQSCFPECAFILAFAHFAE